MTMEFSAELWVWSGKGAWYFVTLPEDLASDIKEAFATHSRGFGSLRVEVEIGNQRWQTSIFPDSKSGSYLLPIKKAVREALNVTAGDRLHVGIRIR